MGKDSIRLGADIGGTFTDVVLAINDQICSAKVLTTYSAPEDAILIGIHQTCAEAGITPNQIQQVIHGTTLATNALIERRGARTAFITTKGFRDVIEMRTESRFEQYDLNLTLPDPLLPRQDRYVLPERIAASGEVLLPLDDTQLDILTDILMAQKYESIAIGFLHAYLDNRHEVMVRDAILTKMPHVMVSLSSEVSPQMREYERFNTTIANAYIKPLMRSYLSRLKKRLSNEDINGDVFLIHSGGGIIALEDAAEFPVRLVESGPAGGAVFAATIAKRYDLDKALSFDMGGTTAKICLIKDHSPKTSRVFEVARSYRFKKGSGMPISIPVIDMVEIGAGGGSLAQVDTMGQIRVGPQSAASEPGPACYDKGGTKPTVTDADLILGKLDADFFAGGSIKINSDVAITALNQHIGKALDISHEAAAFGISEMVDENMANAARVHAVENGEDLAEYTMIAFGGAAPLHAARLCQKLGIKRVLIPKGAGVGSAIGFLAAPFSFEATRSLYMQLDNFNAEKVSEALKELQDEAIAFVNHCDPNAHINIGVKAYMRYQGQGWEIPITFPETISPDAEILKHLFEQEYTKLFARPVHGMAIEITLWTVNATTPPLQVNKVREIEQTTAAKAEITRALFDPTKGEFTPSDLIRRNDLSGGQTIKAPALLIEDETTIIIPQGFKGFCQTDDTIDIRKTKE